MDWVMGSSTPWHGLQRSLSVAESLCNTVRSRGGVGGGRPSTEAKLNSKVCKESILYLVVKILFLVIFSYVLL